MVDWAIQINDCPLFQICLHRRPTSDRTKYCHLLSGWIMLHVLLTCWSWLSVNIVQNSAAGTWAGVGRGKDQCQLMSSVLLPPSTVCHLVQLHPLDKWYAILGISLNSATHAKSCSCYLLCLFAVIGSVTLLEGGKDFSTPNVTFQDSKIEVWSMQLLMTVCLCLENRPSSFLIAWDILRVTIVQINKSHKTFPI